MITFFIILGLISQGTPCNVQKNAVCSGISWDDAIISLQDKGNKDLVQINFRYMLEPKGLLQINNFTLPVVRVVIVVRSIVPLNIMQDLVKMHDLHIYDSNVQCWTNEDTFTFSNIKQLEIDKSFNCSQTPSFPFPNLQQLSLTNNNFKSIPFTGSSSISSLSLLRNNITSVSNLENLSKLTQLDLSNNPLVYLPVDAFHSNPKLSHLHLSNTLLGSLSFRAPSLLTLTVNNCKLKTLSTLFFKGLPDLMTLDLSHNQISNLTDHFNELIHLLHLDLSYNQKLNLADFIFDNLVSIETLKLSSIDLTQMPQQTTVLHDLHHLDISNNALVTLNAEFFTKTPTLASLYVNNNLLISFNAAKVLTSLRSLDLSNNYLKLHEEKPLEGMSSLLNLKITNNLVDGDVHRIINYLPSLRELYADNNRFTGIKCKACRSHLKIVNLANNSLTCGRKLRNNFKHLLKSQQYDNDLVELYTENEFYSDTHWLASYEHACPEYHIHNATEADSERIDLHGKKNIESSVDDEEQKVVTTYNQKNKEARTRVPKPNLSHQPYNQKRLFQTSNKLKLNHKKSNNGHLLRKYRLRA